MTRRGGLANMRTHLLAMGILAFLLGLFPQATLSQPPAHVGFDYGETKFLVSSIGYEYCGAVPNPSSMKLLQPSDWADGKCDTNKFGAHVFVSVLGSLIFVFLAIFFGLCVFPCACFLRFRFGFFGGRHRTPTRGIQGTVLPNRDLDSHNGYSPTTIACTRLSLGVLFTVAMFGGAVVLVSSSFVSRFIWEASAILDAYPEYHVDTTFSLLQTLSEMVYTNDEASIAVMRDSLALAKDLRSSGESEITDQLRALDRGVQAALYIVVALVFLAGLIGIYAAVFRTGGLALLVAFLLTFLVALVWGEFSFIYGASNTIDLMCDTIDRCHFCYMGQFPSWNNGSNVHCTKDYCDVSWFNTMQHCSDATSARYSALETMIQGAMATAANATCLRIADVCGTAFSSQVSGCALPNGPCSLNNLLNNGLSAVAAVTLKPDGRVESIPFLAQDAQVSTQLQAAAQAAVDQAGLLASYSQQLTQAQTLDCGSQVAFIESVPDGTYNRLQMHLCPVPPVDKSQYTLQQILDILASGLLIIGCTLPFVQFVLCLGHKRFAKRAKRAHGGFEDESLVESINTKGGWGR